MAKNAWKRGLELGLDYNDAMCSSQPLKVRPSQVDSCTVYRPCPHVFLRIEKIFHNSLFLVYVEQFFYSKNHGVRDKWNNGLSFRIIQNCQQAFRSFYTVSENAQRRHLIAIQGLLGQIRLYFLYTEL